MQSALAKVEGVTEAKVSMPDKAVITGSVSAEALIEAINGSGGRYSAALSE